MLQLVLPVESGAPEAVQLVPRRSVLNVKPLRTDFPEILQRPIFAPDRHRMMEPMSGFTLAGIGIAGERTSVLLQSSSGVVVRGRLGDLANGWQIVSIAPDRVYFERQGERRISKLDVAGRRALSQAQAQAGGK